MDDDSTDGGHRTHARTLASSSRWADSCKRHASGRRYPSRPVHRTMLVGFPMDRRAAWRSNCAPMPSQMRDMHDREALPPRLVHELRPRQLEFYILIGWKALEWRLL